MEKEKYNYKLNSKYNIKRKYNSLLRLISSKLGMTFSFGNPDIIQIESTNHCPLDCIMCPRRHMTRARGFIDLFLFKKIVDQIKTQGEPLCLHHFGEPLLHPRLHEMIKYAQSKGIRTRVSINPGSFTDQKISNLIDSKLDSMIVCIDGMDKETHESIRQHSNFEKTMNGLDKFLKEKIKANSLYPHVIISMVKSKANEHQVDEFKRTFENKPGVDEVWLKEYSTWDGSHEEINNLVPTSGHSKKFNTSDYRVCQAPWKSIAVMYDGRVVPCCLDYDGKVVLGDLKKESLKQIWNGQKMKELRKQHLENDFKDNSLCAGCKEKLF